MTAREFKERLSNIADDDEVEISVNTPAGWVCPDGALVPVEGVYQGFDWHTGKVIIIPKCKLDIHSIEDWSGRGKREGTAND